MSKIMLVDDDPDIRDLAGLYLKKEGFEVFEVENGEEALKRVETFQPQLIVLDIMLPGLDGLTVCRKLREKHHVPIIMLTARDSDVDKILGLELGADDYITKPFNPRELAARAKAILRRVGVGNSPGKALELGSLKIDKARRAVTVQSRQIQMRTREFDLLVALAENPGIVFSRDQLLERVWGMDYFGETRTVDVHVARLREHLAGGEVIIQTIRGVGYKLFLDSREGKVSDEDR